MDKKLVRVTHVVEFDGFKVLSDACYSEQKNKQPLVIFAHGYKGFKDWGAWKMALEALAHRGFYAVKFNFSLNGTTLENPLEFGDLDAFGRNTYSQEQEDLKQVIDFYAKDPLVDCTKIFLIGHSRAGGSVLLQGYTNAKVYGVICWAGVSDFRKRFPHKELFEKWEKEGVFYIENGRTKQKMPHYFSFWLDYLHNEKKLNVQTAAQKFTKPCLLIQGTQDAAIPVKEAELLHRWIKGSELVLLAHADHVFGATHPFTKNELPEDLRKVVECSADFIERELSR